MAKIKVSQKTIDDIKKMGMTKALKLAGMNASATQAGAVAEYQEAARRMYGAKRVAAADKAYRAANAPKKPTDSRFSSGTAKKATSGSYTTGSGVSKAKPSNSSTYQTGRGVVAKKAVAPKKATPPAKKQSDFEKTISGVKRILNSSPGANLRMPKPAKKKNTTLKYNPRTGEKL